MKRVYLLMPLLSLALLVSACGNDSAPSAVDATPTTVVELADPTDTPEIADTEGITETDPAAAAEETAIPGSDQTPSMTDTVGITDTQSITDSASMTDTDAPSDATSMTDTTTITGTDGGMTTTTGTPSPSATLTATSGISEPMTDTVDAASVVDDSPRGVIRASDLLSYDVENAEEEGLGSIDDAIISLEHGCINYLLLSFGGILGLGDNQYLIPWRAVTIDPTQERLLLNIDPSALDAAPIFDADNLPDMTMGDWDNELTGYWDSIDVTASEVSSTETGLATDEFICDSPMPVEPDGGIGSSETMTETVDAEPTAAATSQGELNVQVPLVIRLSELLDYSVHNPEGEDLGTIHDMMIDWQQDRLAYGILSFGGFMGLGEKWFVIPLEDLTLDPIEQRLIFDTDPELLQDAPGFDADNLPDTADPDWDLGIREYWESLR